MDVGQQVRVNPASSVAKQWNIPREARGTVICRYRVERESSAAPDRLEVQFTPRLILWGAPDREFEPVPR
jgi:hypothetical protein